jgi:hypothetical protein
VDATSNPWRPRLELDGGGGSAHDGRRREEEGHEEQAAAEEHGREEAVLALTDLVADDGDEPQEHDPRERREVHAADHDGEVLARGESLQDVRPVRRDPQQQERRGEEGGEQEAGDARRPRRPELPPGLLDGRHGAGGRSGGTVGCSAYRLDLTLSHDRVLPMSRARHARPVRVTRALARRPARPPPRDLVAGVMRASRRRLAGGQCGPDDADPAPPPVRFRTLPRPTASPAAGDAVGRRRRFTGHLAGTDVQEGSER